MSDIILHHYQASLFSEKVRAALGLKGLEWNSVEIPNMMPKPDLMPLTGGYRKTPVMQIGADIYCDTQSILIELERRFPEPSFYPAGDEGTARALAIWADRTMFQAAVGVVFGNLAKSDLASAITPAFLEDRQKLFKGAPAPVIEDRPAAVPHMRDQLRAGVAMMAGQLGDGRNFLMGDNPGLVDLHLYFNTWFVRGAAADDAKLIFDGYRDLVAWEGRMAALGHGDRREMDSKEALAIARDAAPATPEAIDPQDPNGRRPGDEVWVMPDDYGRNPVRGTLVASDAQTIAIRHRNSIVDEVAIHFPRQGFIVGDKSIEDKIAMADPTFEEKGA